MTTQGTHTNAHQANGINPRTKQTERYILPRDPKKAIFELINVIDDLCELYEKENETLKDAKTKQFSGLQDQKIILARKYQSGLQQLTEREDEIKALPKHIIDMLVAKQKTFSDIAANNLQALEKVKRAVGRLNDFIMDSVRKEAEQTLTAYTKSGTAGKTDRTVSMGFFETA